MEGGVGSEEGSVLVTRTLLIWRCGKRKGSGRVSVGEVGEGEEEREKKKKRERREAARMM